MIRIVCNGLSVEPKLINCPEHRKRQPKEFWANHERVAGMPKIGGMLKVRDSLAFYVFQSERIARLQILLRAYRLMANPGQAIGPVATCVSLHAHPADCRVGQ
jgi:hypothetical protein